MYRGTEIIYFPRVDLDGLPPTQSEIDRLKVGMDLRAAELKGKGRRYFVVMLLFPVFYGLPLWLAQKGYIFPQGSSGFFLVVLACSSAIALAARFAYKLNFQAHSAQASQSALARPANEARLKELAGYIEHNGRHSYLAAISGQGREITEVEACALIDRFQREKQQAVSDSIRSAVYGSNQVAS